MSVKRDAEMMSGVGKRSRVTSPSPVLHVSNLPSDCTDPELASIAAPFGEVVNVLILRNTRQGFVQMASISQSAALIQCYSQMSALIRGQQVYFDYSDRQQITTPQPRQSESPPSNIILVTISQPLVQITVDLLYPVFSAYGNVKKIVVFQKNDIQALVEFSDQHAAMTVKQLLNNYNFQGYCTFRIQFSNLGSVTVKTNGPKSRDYTNPGLPATNPLPQPVHPPGASHRPTLPGPGAPSSSLFSEEWGQPPQFDAHGQPTHSPYSFPGASPFGAPVQQGNPVIIASGLNEQLTTAEIASIFGVYGDVLKVKILFNKQNTALIQFENAMQADLAIQNLNGLMFRGTKFLINHSKYSDISVRPDSNPPPEGRQLTQEFHGNKFHRFKVQGSKNYQNITRPAATLHISNIPEGTDEEELRSVFTPHGTVKAVQFFLSNKKLALCELASIEEAVEALIKADTSLLKGNNIRVSFSKSQIKERPVQVTAGPTAPTAQSEPAVAAAASTAESTSAIAAADSVIAPTVQPSA